MRHEKLVSLTLVIAVLVAALVPAAMGGDGGQKARRPSTVLYKMKDGAKPAQLGALTGILMKRNAQTVRRIKNLNINMAKFTAAGVSEEQVCAELMATGAVLYAEPDYLVAPVVIPNDPSYSSQWQHTKIRSPEAWTTTTGTTSVLVGVCDTGVSSAHPDLAANLQLPGYNSVDGSTNSEPVYNHGTGVAGCIGAVGNNGVGVAGVNWSVKILPIRISNLPTGNAYTIDAADGIRYAADQGAKVANLSYRMAQYSTINDAGNYLRGKGGLLFVAAGNDGVDPDWPDFAGFIAVGSTTSSDARSSFSSYGTYIDIVAPGSSVYSTSGASGYNYMSGTSFASPISAGLAALLYSMNTSFTPDQVQSFIFSSCVDLGDPGEDNVFGHGRIDAAAAVALAASPNNSPTAVASATPTTGTAPLLVTFDGTGSSDSDGTISLYRWNFGDGASADGAVVAHTYSSAGTYFATLTVTDDKGATDSATAQIVVDPDPNQVVYVHNIGMAIIEVRGGLQAQATVTIVDLGGTPVPGAVVSGTWTGPKTRLVSGTTGSVGTVTLASLKAKGTFTYTFTVTGVNASGYTYNANLNVETSDSISNGGTTTNQPPNAVATADPSSGIAPLAVTLDGSGSSDPDGQIVSHAWNFGDGSSGTGATLAHTYTAAGTYSAVLTVTDDKGATDSATVSINVVDDASKVIYVSNIAVATAPDKGGNVAVATVTIVNMDGSPVMGATVTGAWSGLVSGSSSGVTDVNGNAVLTSRKSKKSGTFTVTVTDALLSGYLYDPSLNVETSDSISQ